MIAEEPIIPSAKSIVPPLAIKLLFPEISPFVLIYNVDSSDNSIALLPVELFNVTSFWIVTLPVPLIFLVVAPPVNIKSLFAALVTTPLILFAFEVIEPLLVTAATKSLLFVKTALLITVPCVIPEVELFV